VANPGADLESHLASWCGRCGPTVRTCSSARAGILHPSTLDAITTKDQGQRTWDSRRLLEHDGAGGGLLLGYPFVVSAATSRTETRNNADVEVKRIFFSSDWGEAWIGAYPGVVQLDVSFDAKFQTDETVLRAVLRHDFAVRRKEPFVHAEL
jgi:hypothetical protein